MRYSWPDASHSILGRFYSDSFKPLKRHLRIWGRICLFLQLVTFGAYGFYRTFPTQEVRIVGPNPAYQPYTRAVRAHELWVWQRNARDSVARNWFQDGTNLELYRKYFYARVLAGEIVSERQIPFNYLFFAERAGTLIPQSNIEEIRGLRSRYLELRGDEGQRAQLVIHAYRETGMAQYSNLTTPDPWWMNNDTTFIPELDFLNNNLVAVMLLRGNASAFTNPMPPILPLGPEPPTPARIELERDVIARRTIPRPMPAFLLVARQTVSPIMLACGVLLTLYHLAKLARARRKTGVTSSLGRAAYRTGGDACTCSHCGAVHPRQPSPSASP